MFRTPIQNSPASIDFKYQDQILALGSCFADIMGQRLQNNKFRAEVNPFGILYHPLSIVQNLQWSLEGVTPPANRYLERDQLHFNYNLHSDFCARDQLTLQQKVNDTFSRIHQNLKTLDCLILTLGTAFYYQHQEHHFQVANCHKMPTGLFQKKCSTVEELVEPWLLLLNQLPAKLVILTVSPIRHLKEGLTENQHSKSVLRVACTELSKQLAHVHYFPAYEIMIDDLRDYRFYEADMIHPNQTAQDYIWDQFIETFTQPATRDIMGQWHKVQKNLQHKPFQTGTQQHHQFLINTLEMIDRLPNHIDTAQEIAWLKKQLQ